MPEGKIGWKHNAYQTSILVVSSVFCVYWHFYLPKAGKALLILGGVAALMLLADLHPKLKAAYVVIIISLIFIENRALDKERADSTNEQIAERKEQNARFQSIADGLTGGDSFSYVYFDHATGNLVVVNHGDYPLTALHVEVSNFPQPQGLLPQTFEFPTLVPRVVTPLFHRNFRDGRNHDLLIAFNAVNGVWIENLQFRPIKGQLFSALRIIRIKTKFVNPDTLGSIDIREIWCKVDDGYPLLNGSVEWNDNMQGPEGRIRLPSIPCTRH